MFSSKVCTNLSEANVIITETKSGLDCKVFCPACNSPITLSSCVNDVTGKCSFSGFNFSRHYAKHPKLNVTDGYRGFVDGLNSGRAGTQFAVSKPDDHRHDSVIDLNATRYSEKMDIEDNLTPALKSNERSPKSSVCTNCIDLEKRLGKMNDLARQYKKDLASLREVQEELNQKLIDKTCNVCVVLKNECIELKKEMEVKNALLLDQKIDGQGTSDGTSNLCNDCIGLKNQIAESCGSMTELKQKLEGIAIATQKLKVDLKKKGKL